MDCSQAELISYLEKNIASCSKTVVRIALVGRIKTGKSTLINTLRGLLPNEVGAAKVDQDIVEINPTAYSSSECPSIEFYDLPGAGGTYNKAEWVNKVNLPFYDAFLLLLNGPWDETLTWVKKQLDKHSSKPYFIVRTCWDDAIRKEKMDRPMNPRSEAELRRYWTTELNVHIGDRQIFFISCYLRYTKKYDYQAFHNALIHSIADETKRATLIFGLKGRSEALLKDKREWCTRLVHQYAALSAATQIGLTIIPGSGLVTAGAGAAIDFSLQVKMNAQIRTCFGVDDNSIITWLIRSGAKGVQEGTQQASKRLAEWIAKEVVVETTEKLTARAFALEVKALSQMAVPEGIKLAASKGSDSLTKTLLQQAIVVIPIAGALMSGGIAAGFTELAGYFCVESAEKTARMMSDSFINNRV